MDHINQTQMNLINKSTTYEYRQEEGQETQKDQKRYLKCLM